MSEITRAEIEHISDHALVVNAYDVVRLLRPWMLTPQSLRDRSATGSTGQASQNEIDVYLDDAWLGGIDGLRSIPLRAIASVRWLSPVEASLRRDSAHHGGAIMVQTVRSG